MTTSRISAALVLSLGALGLSGISCTAILAPRDDVQRCGTADDCDPTGDNRYIPDCTFGDEELDSVEVSKICVASFKPNVGCDPLTLTDPAHPFRMNFDDFGEVARYVSCDETQAGSIGCRPMPSGACADGLTVNELGFCDDDDDSVAYLPETEELLGQDIRDQFCRSFFCDDSFVCDADTNFCVQCDPDEEVGQGGCGEVFIGGQRSCIYNDGDACEGSDVTDRTVTFGAC